LYTRRNVELDDILTQFMAAIDGVLGVAIGGMDGLLVEQLPADNRTLISGMVAENANLLRSTVITYKNVLGLGAVSEIIVQSEKAIGYVRPINTDFFLTIILEPKGNLGKTRLVSTETVRQLQKVLS
jgi:predicted regulator of Ras-like GTPase activity (Roadblock/LC7/MglB family)